MVTLKSSSGTIPERKNPWAWVPSLYFASGFPYLIVTAVAAIMYKRLGVSNSEIALYTSWLYIPWVIKPLWSPFVDIFRTKRSWIYSMELLIGMGMAGVAFTIPMPDFFQFSLAFFWFIAFLSATHDASADGFYIDALKKKEQSSFIGIRLVFYRGAMIAAQSAVILFAGLLENNMSIGPSEFKVVSNPNAQYVESIKFDTLQPQPLPGAIRIIAEPSYIDISTRQKTTDEVSSYVAFAHNFNIMNGFSRENIAVYNSIPNVEFTGNIGTVWLHLSKPPEGDKEYIVNLNMVKGCEGMKLIEGKTFRFNANNWNRPAIAVVQLDQSITNIKEATFKAEANRIPLVWMITFGTVAGLFILLAIYHKFYLPDPITDTPRKLFEGTSFIRNYFKSIFRFFEKRRIGLAILFLLFYRFSEAQLIKITPLFLMDSREAGGLALSTQEVGLFSGGLGLIPFLVGGLIGGFAIAKKGLRFWLWPMFFAINIPQAIYLYLSFTQPTNNWIVYSCIGGEQFFTGFGFIAYIMFMNYLADGDYKASHFAFAMGFMALGMMLPGMLSGFIQEALGYRYFFIWLIAAIVPSFFIVKSIRKKNLYL